VLEHLSSLFVDVEGLVSSLKASQEDQGAVLRAERESAADRLADLRLRDGKLRERLAVVVGEGKDPSVLEETLSQQRPESDGLERRLAELDQRLSTVVDNSPTDSALDWWSRLRDETAGALRGSSVREVREALRVRFTAFVLDTDTDAVTVRPLLRLDPTISEAKRWLRRDDAPAVPVLIQTGVEVSDSHR
jgi:hypothetical protein